MSMRENHQTNEATWWAAVLATSSRACSSAPRPVTADRAAIRSSPHPCGARREGRGGGGVEEEGAAAASAGPLVPAPSPQPPPLTSGGKGVTREKERGRESSRCGKREPPIVEKPR